MDIKKIINEEIQSLNEANDIGGSLWGLIKYNGGYFKSDKQRDFFLNKAKKQTGENILTAGGEVYGNTYTNFFHLDNSGVTKVQKQTRAQGVRTTWERSEENTQKARSAALNTKFGKAMQKYMADINQKFEELKNQKFAEFKESRNPQSMYDSILKSSRGDINKLNQDIQQLKDAINNNPSDLLQEYLAMTEFIKYAFENDLINSYGMPFRNFHPEFYVMDENSPDYRKLKPEYRSPEAKQEFIDKMSGQ